MKRQLAVIANWKMEFSHKASLSALESLRKQLRGVDTAGVDVVVCPSFTVLSDMRGALEKSSALQLGAQNVHWAERGAFTGQISAMQLKSLVTWCIIGHSEQRSLTGETDEQIQQKAVLLAGQNITPVICVGETREERNAGGAVKKVTAQIASILAPATRASLPRYVIVYEPVWAIGTGETPQPAEAAETMLLVRKLAAERFGNEAADRLRILYGGSVNPDNTRDFMSEPGIDGLLVGGASLRPVSLVSIIKQVRSFV